MDRQAAALFGGIVAVGLGPAVWLGGTLVRPDHSPVPAPSVTSQVTVRPTIDGVPRPVSDPLPSVPAAVTDASASPGAVRPTPTDLGRASAAPQPKPTWGSPTPGATPASPRPHRLPPRPPWRSIVPGFPRR